MPVDLETETGAEARARAAALAVVGKRAGGDLGELVNAIQQGRTVEDMAELYSAWKCALANS